MIRINIEKAKNIAHDVRRAKRAEEFAPLDVKATIPAEAKAAEAARQAVRDKYADMQAAIDQAATPDELKAIIS
jgi:predicted flap endonuclease-1-like 5' DNA nuclease